MKDYHKAYLKNSDVDMKKLQKPRMDDSERMERRERDKLARQQIQNPAPEISLFPAPVRVSPSEGDSRIESKLGDYAVAKKLISLDPAKCHTQVIGITSAGKGPVQRPNQPIQPPLEAGLSSLSTSTFSAPQPPNNRNLPPPSAAHHYHQPHPSLLSSQSGRGSSSTFLKQPDNKQPPTYNGRVGSGGGYPIQPVNKHDIHPKGLSLGPPAMPPMMSNGRLNDKPPVSGSIPNGGGRFQVPSAPKQKFPAENSEPPPSVNGDVDSILKEMTMRTNYTPLTEIAATPRKENENKFSFGQPNPHKYAELPPLFKPPSNKQRIVNVPKATDLENDLDLSESDDERKKQTSVDHTSTTNDNSSESSDSASSESGSEESNSGAKGETSTQTDKWHLSKYFLKPAANDAVTQPSPHEINSQIHEPNIKHEPMPIVDDDNLSPSPSTYRLNSSNQIPHSLSSSLDIKKEGLPLSSSLDVQPNQIKTETFEKSPSSSPEKKHSDTVESDQIESVLAAAQVLAEIKPVSEIGTSSEDEKKKSKRKKSPSKKPGKRRRKVQKEKVGSDSSDEEEFSSANTLSSERGRSNDKEKKTRGRPRKNAAAVPVVSLPIVVNKSPVIVTTPVKNSVPNKRDAVRKAPTRRTSRQSSMAISREFLGTTSDSSSDDQRTTVKKPIPIIPPQPVILAKVNESSRLTRIQKPHSPVATKSSHDDDDDDDSSSSSRHSGEDRLSSPADRGSSRQQYSPGHRSSARSKPSSSSSSDDHSDSDDPRENKKIRDKTKSDKNKSDTLRKLFVPNRGEGGAKGKGQVLIVDQSEESQNQTKEVPVHHEKLLSPIAFKHSAADASNQINANNIKSPRTAVAPSAASIISNNLLRTPERNQSATNLSAKHQNVAGNNASINSSTTNSSSRTSVICKIELSRLIRVPSAWYQNSYTLRGSGSAQTNNSSTNNNLINLLTNHAIQSATSDDDRRKSPITSVTSKNNNGNGKLNRNCSDNLLNSNNHSNNNSTSNISNNSRLVNNELIVGNQSAAVSRNVDGISKSSLQSNSENTGGNKTINDSNSNENYPYNLDKHSNRNITKETKEQSANPIQHQSQQLILSPKHEELLLRHSHNTIKSSGIKHEQIKSEFNDDYSNYSALPSSSISGTIGGSGITTKQQPIDTKCNIYNSTKLSNNNTVKQEQLIKNEYKNSIVTNESNQNQTSSAQIAAAAAAAAISLNNTSNSSMKSTSSDEHSKSRRKRSSSSSSSPFKDKKRKKGTQLQSEVLEQLPPTNHDRLPEKIILPPPAQPIQKIYKSYFERTNEEEFRLGESDGYLQEAKHLKHMADKEPDQLNQVSIYLTAVIYFLSSASCMESERPQPAFTIYKDTLSLIKYISSKIFHPSTNDTVNKMAILSLRCQSLIHLKMYKLKRADSKDAQKTANQFFNKGTCEILNGNTPSISPSSVCSQSSGSNTPPLQMVPIQVHAAFQRQSIYFNYLSTSHDLWDQADILVKTGKHSDFFIDLDHTNGPLTLHSPIYDLFKYVQCGLHKLKNM